MSNYNLAYNFTHLKSIENKNIHRLWSVFWRYHHLNYFLLCHCQHILHSINIVCVIAMSNVEFDCLFFHIEIRCGFNLIFDGLRLAHIERSNYIESNTLGRKRCPVSGIERIRYPGCFITVKIEGKIWDR